MGTKPERTGFACTWRARIAVAVGFAVAIGAAFERSARAENPSATPAGSISGSATVLAAASLTSAFQSASSEFEHAHPGLKLELSFGGSPTLVQQIQQGAPADVFASADEANMQKLVESGHITGEAYIFACNELAIAVAPGNPKHVSMLADLSKPGLTIVLCGSTVPCGRYAAQAFEKAGIAVPAASQETDVKAVVSKVALGEADAGVVYTTDIRAAGGKVEGVAIPEAQNVVGRYPIAVLKEARNPAAARAFVGFILAPRGQAILAGFGFRGGS